MELFRFGALYKGKNCQQDEMLLQDWCYFRNRSSLLTTFMYFTSRCCVKSWVNTKMSWMYKLFCLRMKITRIWLWYVLYIYTPFGILTSFPVRDGERGQQRLKSGLRPVHASWSCTPNTWCFTFGQQPGRLLLCSGGRLQWIWVTIHLGAFW